MPAEMVHCLSIFLPDILLRGRTGVVYGACRGGLPGHHNEGTVAVWVSFHLTT